MLKIEISKRHYNGDFGVGSIFEEKYNFDIKENLCISNSTKSFCNNDNFGENILSTINLSIPFILKDNDNQKLSEIIISIQNNSCYLYNKEHYNKDVFDFNRYNYIDIIINGINYEILEKDNAILDSLKQILKIDEIDKILGSTLNNIISLEDNHE